MKLIEVKNAGFSYNKYKKIFSGVSFSLEPGQTLSILGANGAGKSTLLNCLANLLALDEGEIIVEGNSIKQMGMPEIAKIIGYVPQLNNPSYGYTVRDFVVMGRAPYISLFRMPSDKDYAYADEAIESMGISYLAEKAYTEISGGERQQASIARVLVQKPKVIMLDEPTAHLDFGNQLRTIKIVKELADRGYTIIMTTHNPDHAIILDDTVGIIGRVGHMQVGSVADIISEKSLKQVYNTELKLAYVKEVGRIACIGNI